MKHATAGNTIILALFVTLLLVTLLLVQIVATKANLQMAAQRTNTAQLNVQSIFTVNSAMKRILAGLPGLASATLNASNLTSSGDFAVGQAIELHQVNKGNMPFHEGLHRLVTQGATLRSAVEALSKSDQGRFLQSRRFR